MSLNLDFPVLVDQQISRLIQGLEHHDISKLISDIDIIYESALLDLRSALKEQLKTNAALILRIPLENRGSISVANFRKFTVLLSRSLGDLVVQNSEGDKLVTVYDRDPNKTMASGARYHQTHEGGSIHTDNVNIPEPWQFLILSCLHPAPVGGENIIVNGDDVVAKMKVQFPQALKILEENFWWEKRGVSDELYQAPIITYDDEGHALFRHLRPYMESAHIRSKNPMTAQQIKAVDILDAYLNSSELQSRFRMQQYDCLVSLDSRTLHGRTCFADENESLIFSDWESNPSKPRRRTMERLWVRES